MAHLSRRSLLRGSLGLLSAAALARPHVANAKAKTAVAWWTQGFIPEEDNAFRRLVADYKRASGNKIDYSIVPFAALRQKEVAALTSGVVPDLMETAFLGFSSLNGWKGYFHEVDDVVETQRSKFSPTALQASFIYNGVTKKRAYYSVPMKTAVVPFHIWKSLVEKAGYKISNLPNTWDAFLDFFEPVQTKLRAQGMRNVYAYGYQLTANGDDPNNTFEQWIIAYGGKGLVTPDGKLHTDDPKVREAAVKAFTKLTTPFKKGFVPTGVTNWNDADDNNALHAKLVVMDYDGTISSEVALYHDEAQYDDMLTHGLPLDNEGKEIPVQLAAFGPVIPKGAKNLEVAKEFLKYAIEPNVLNQYLKGGLGRWLPTMPSIARSDPFWLKTDPHRTAYTEMSLGLTIPTFDVFNPGFADARTEHTLPVAGLDVCLHDKPVEQAVDEAFKRLEAIFARYPIAAA